MRILNQHRSLTNSLIIGSFVIWALLSVITIVIMNRYHVIGDLAFHWQRINEIRSGLSHFSLPTLATNYFSGNGSAVMSFYPSLTLIPIALLTNWVKDPIVLFASFILMCDLAGLIISYFACHGFARNSRVSYLFSVMYMSGLNMLLPQGDYGNDVAIALLPFVFFGMLSLLKRNQWLELSIGLTLMIYTHVLDSAITIVFLIILALFNVNRLIRPDKLKSLGLASGITIAATAAFWLPALQIGLLNQLVKPFSTALKSESFRQMVRYAVNPDTYLTGPSIEKISVGIFSLAAIVLSLIYYRHLNRIAHQLFWISIGFMLIYSNLARPLLNYLTRTPVSLIQFPARVTIIPSLLLSYLLAVILGKKMTAGPILQRSVCGATVLLAITLPIIITNNYVNLAHPCQRHAQPMTYQQVITSHQLFSHDFVGRNDYYPLAANADRLFLLRDRGFYGSDHHKIPFVSHGNGQFTFQTDRALPKLVVPFVSYHGIQYQMTLDNRSQPVQATKHQLLMLTNVKPGVHQLQISETDPTVAISRLIALIGVIAWASEASTIKLRHRKI